MVKEIWVGTIEISYLDHEGSDKQKNASNVVTTWGSSAEEFNHSGSVILRKPEGPGIASTAIYAVPTDEQVGRAGNTALAGLF